jgi:HCOMODA/2-hydroxy-3-carboxy-muconic semialdehyde decarboxylase
MAVATDRVLEDLVMANHILGVESILDAFGHVSVRDPERADCFVMSRARAPELVEAGDLMEFDLAGVPAEGMDRIPYIERFIHAGIYAARPEVMAICHNHTPSILPFSISTDVRLRAVVHSARFIGGDVPVWDIASEFGPDTDMLVRNIDHGNSLARAVGGGNLALMRGHGSVVVAPSVAELVSRCLGMDRNARVQLAAASLGGYIALSEGESRQVAVPAGGPGAPSDNRAWEYYCDRAARAASR